MGAQWFAVERQECSAEQCTVVERMGKAGGEWKARERSAAQRRGLQRIGRKGKERTGQQGKAKERQKRKALDRSARNGIGQAGLEWTEEQGSELACNVSAGSQ